MWLDHPHFQNDAAKKPAQGSMVEGEDDLGVLDTEASKALFMRYGPSNTLRRLG